MDSTRMLWGLLGSAFIAYPAWRRGSLSTSGALAALCIGTIIFIGGGLSWFAMLITFFLTSTLLGKVGKTAKAQTKKEFSKGDQRDAFQAFANGGIAMGAALLSIWQPSVFASGAFLGALATANGDTWATEVGILSKTHPISLLSLKRVPSGTSGAVSWLGMSATMGGACLISLVAAVLDFHPGVDVMRLLLVGTVAGTAGSLVDSLLGATLQSGFHCPQCQRVTEGSVHHCGTATRHTRGLRWLGNDGVNALATLSGALLGGWGLGWN